MGHRTRQLLLGLSGIFALVSVGSIVAAVNWYSISRSITPAGAEQGPPTPGLLEAQATFQQWTVVAIIGVVFALASWVVPTCRTSRGSTRNDVGRG